MKKRMKTVRAVGALAVALAALVAGAEPSYDEQVWEAAAGNRIPGDLPGDGTGFYVGRKVSADGTTMIGRTVDAEPFNGPMREVRFERGKRVYADGTANDYAFTCTCRSSCLGAGLCCDGAINEKGVMLSGPIGAEARMDATNAEAFVSCAAGGYGAETCRTT